MSTTNLASIFSLLQEQHQEQAILDRMEYMAANAEWGEVEKLLPPIFNLQDKPQFKAKALLIGIKCAIRLRNIELALKRYEILSAITGAANLSDIQPKALYVLASQILPNKAKKILFYWLELANIELTPIMRRELKDTGDLLMEAFNKNQDYLSWQCLQKLMKDKFGGK